MVDVTSWTASATRRWFGWCSMCQTRRLVADYFEGYLLDGHGWLWVCASCLVEELSTRIAEEEGKRHHK